MPTHAITGKALTSGTAQAPVLFGDTPLSFWGGVQPTSGEIIDRHHPLSGKIITGQVLALPSGRGSCTGSSVMMEVILNGRGPAALILEQPDEILALGAIVAELVFGKGLPVVVVGSAGFAAVREAAFAAVNADGSVSLSDSPLPAPAASAAAASGEWFGCSTHCGEAVAVGGMGIPGTESKGRSR